MNGHPRPAARTRLGLRAALFFLLLVGAPARASVPPPAGLSRSFEAACTRARRSVVTVVGLRTHEDLRRAQGAAPRPTRSLASGVVVDRRGHVLTAASVVRDCDQIQVRLDDGRAVTAMLLGVDDASDVALLGLPVHDVPALRWASDPAVPVGAWVAAVGQSAYGRVPEDAKQPCLGMVQHRYEAPLGSLLLLTNEVLPGFSGAPAINSRGELVGLVIGRLSQVPTDWSEGDVPVAGASFALAGDDLKTVLEHLERYGRVRRGFLGVRMAQGEVVDSNRPGDPYKIGVRVEEVLAGSPAAQVGLRTGDLVVGWNGETLQSPEDLMRRVEGSPPGTRAALVWVRADERFDGTLVVGAKPDEEELAGPEGAGGSILPGDRARQSEELLERVRTLRTRTPGASPDTAGHAHPG